jgi:type IX secretion system PorP/SprF family membrane protein
MKKYIYIYLLLCVIHARAQQLPQYSNYMINGYVMNPAVGGSNSYFEAKCDSRYQWVGINDAPRTYILSVNGPTKSLNMGLGGMLFSDVTGPTRRTGIYLSYAYHLKLTEKIKASLGISGGALQFVVDGSKITMHDPNDGTIGTNPQTLTVPDFGAGAYVYSTDKKWYVGASVPQVLQSRVKFFDYSTATTSRLAAHAYITGAYNFNVASDFKVEPSACIKYVAPAPLQFDIGVRGIYKDKYWIGAVYRYLDAVSAIVGFNVKENISVAYSYDYALSSIKKYSTGTHELMLGIRFHKVESSETSK